MCPVQCLPLKYPWCTVLPRPVCLQPPHLPQVFPLQQQQPTRFARLLPPRLPRSQRVGYFRNSRLSPRWKMHEFLTMLVLWSHPASHGIRCCLFRGERRNPIQLRKLFFRSVPSRPPHLILSDFSPTPNPQPPSPSDPNNIRGPSD